MKTLARPRTLLPLQHTALRHLTARTTRSSIALACSSASTTTGAGTDSTGAETRTLRSFSILARTSPDTCSKVSMLACRRRSDAATKLTSLANPAGASPISLFRSYSTSLVTPSLTAPSSLPGLFSTLWARFPRLGSEDSSSRFPTRKRKYPSPLFDRPPPSDPRPASSSSSSSNGGPGRKPPRPSSSGSNFSIAGIIALIDHRVFSKLPERFVLYTILGLNVAVFASWLYASSSLRRFSDPRAYLFMSKNFLSGDVNMAQGRWWTLLTSCVSHERLDHFLVNMISLSFMAPPVLALAGPTTFALLYFGAGIVSSLVSIAGKRMVKKENGSALPPGRSGLSQGASGSVYAIMSAFACVHPTATFLVFFVIPAPAWAVVSGIFAWDLWHAARLPGGQIDSAGHVGGILAGILFWRFGLRGVRLH